MGESAKRPEPTPRQRRLAHLQHVAAQGYVCNTLLWHAFCFGTSLGGLCENTKVAFPQGHAKRTLSNMRNYFLTLRLAVSLLLAACAANAMALTSTEANDLLYLKQEEKLARDVYQALGAKWMLPAFSNIAVAEQRHMTAVNTLILRYGLADTTPADVGIFSIPELQALYDELIERGSASLQGAISVGLLIEQTDITDLEEALSRAQEQPIRTVLSNLLAGSYNHLSAFSRIARRI